VASSPDAGAEGETPDGGDAPGARPVHDVLVSIPLRHRLSTKLFGMAAALALAALGALWLAERRIQHDLLASTERSTALLAEAIQASTEDAMLGARPAHAYDHLRRIAGLQGVEQVRVVDKRGRIVYSTSPGEPGQVLAKDAGACGACHAGAQPLSRASVEARAQVLDGPRGRHLSMTSPIYNGPSCATAACHVHPPGRQLLGLLEIGVSLQPLEANVLAFRQGFVALLAAAVVVIAGLLYLFGRAEVVEPVAALVEGTRRVARDELDVEIRVQTKGEMGLLAGSFNDMTRSLRRLEDELAILMANLEEQVEARTEELRTAHAQLVRTEKLSSLGKLSASIAHEINNPLAGILTFAKLVSRTLAEGPPDDARRAVMQKNLALVERETQRCSAIVKNLLDFARERPIRAKASDTNAAVQEALALIAKHFAIQGVTLVRVLGEVPPVLADFGQLRQAFVNVAMNACEAMEGGGTLRIETRPGGRGVEVVFADTGPGIPPERLQKIFDPFFTTKEKGTGLGLSVVYGIVERHGGRVHVDSEVGAGTTFTLELPLAADELELGEPTPPPGSAAVAPRLAAR
jgi:two-component system NtrC family sensor kinase